MWTRFRHLLLAASVVATGIGAAPAAPTVHIKDDAFFPARLVVAVNQRVLFVNDDDDAHTVTATSGLFDSKGLDTHAQWSRRFSKPGTYTYFCSLHPFMKGTIVVRAVR